MDFGSASGVGISWDQKRNHINKKGVSWFRGFPAPRKGVNLSSTRWNIPWQTSSQVERCLVHPWDSGSDPTFRDASVWSMTARWRDDEIMRISFFFLRTEDLGMIGGYSILCGGILLVKGGLIWFNPRNACARISSGCLDSLRACWCYADWTHLGNPSATFCHFEADRIFWLQSCRCCLGP